MTQLHHYDNTGTARFITFSCFRRLPYLNHPEAKNILVEEIDRARNKHHLKLLAYVLMPEHVHLVLVPPEGTRIGYVIGEVKSRAAKRFFAASDLTRAATNRVFWEKRCYDHNCRTVDAVREKINYCHKNPVTRGLVSDPSEWMWSSFNWHEGQRDVPLRMDEVLL